MSLSDWLARVQQSFRTRRMRRFAAAFPEAFAGRAGAGQILDVGGTAEIWKLLPGAPSVVILNMPRADARPVSADAGDFSYVAGDGCRIPFADRSFGIVFSNSVIEHVGGPDAQLRFAREVARTGGGYWVQTPNRYFPVEMHLLTPFVHFLPGGLRAFVVRRFTFWQLIRRPGDDEKEFYLEHFISDIRLLSARELQGLFPDATIIRERFFGLTKSLIAYRAN